MAGGQATNEEWRNGVKYVKLKAIIDLCNRYRVYKKEKSSASSSSFLLLKRRAVTVVTQPPRYVIF